MLTILVYTFHVLICFFLIAVVLLQQGKGADLSVFGGGGTQTAFGARGAATVLHKMTVGSFVAFIITTLSIGVLQDDSGSNVIENLPEAGAPLVPGADEEAEIDETGALPTSSEPSEIDAADPADAGSVDVDSETVPPAEAEGGADAAAMDPAAEEGGEGSDS